MPHFPRFRFLMVFLAATSLITTLGVTSTAGPIGAASSDQSTRAMATPAAGAAQSAAMGTAVQSCSTAPAQTRLETIIVPFVNGTTGVMTKGCYKGQVVVHVSGIGQASATQWSDAFYVFTDPQGHAVPPIHLAPPVSFYTFLLWINGGPCDPFVQSISRYHNNHNYTFNMTAPGGPLTFAVGDTMTSDNTGYYKVTLWQR